METNRIIRIEKQSGKYIFAKEGDFSQNDSIANSPSSTKHSESPCQLNEKYESKKNNSKTKNQKENPFEIKTLIPEEHPCICNPGIKINCYLTREKKNIEEDLDENFLHDEEDIYSERMRERYRNERMTNNISTFNNGKKNLTEEEKIIIDALISFDEYNFKVNSHKLVTVNNELFFQKQEPKFVSNIDDKTDEKFLYEKKIYETVEKRIQKYYEYYKIYERFKLEESILENENFKIFVKRTCIFEEDEKYNCIGFKAVVISIVNLITQFMINDFLKPLLDNKNEFDLHTFYKILDKYNKVKELCPYLRKDFELFIYSFQKKNNLNFCICELISESFWDCIFRIHLVNDAFVINYKHKNLSYKTIKTMQTIMSGLSEFYTSYKCFLDTSLGINTILFKHDFVCEIMKIREKKAKSNNNENINENNNKNNNENNNDNDKNNNNEDVNTNNIKNDEKINDNVINNNENNKDNDLNDNENNNDNESNNNKINTNTENYSLDEVYKFIQGDDEESKKKAKKKKKGKKTKNKKNDEKIVQEVPVQEKLEVDPVVEDFVKFLKDFNDECRGYKKIKPIISEKWIDSLKKLDIS